MSQYDYDGLYQFLTSTPERGLRQMLIDENFSEIHFNLLMKVVRSCNVGQFIDAFNSQMYPRIRLNPKESKIKESFWQDCQSCMLERGVLFEASKAA